MAIPVITVPTVSVTFVTQTTKKGAQVVVGVKAIIRRAVVADLIRSITPGQFFTMEYAREMPKCTSCFTRSKKWKGTGIAVCPKCGGGISHSNVATCQRCVSNPKNTAYTPKGTGMSWQDGLAQGIIKYYDIKAINPKTGLKEPQYRECLIDNLNKITVHGTEYTVI